MPKSIHFVIVVSVLAGLAFSTYANAQENNLQRVSPTTPQTLAGHVTSSGTALDGTINEVITQRSSGSPQGLHLIVNSSMKTVDVSVGPYLSPTIKKQLSAGSTVHITGTMQSVGGKDYLLAQEIVVGDKKLTIRNQNGFLVHNFSPTSKRTHAEQNGGAN